MKGVVEWFMNIVINFFDMITFWKDWDTFSLIFAVGLIVMLMIAYYYMKQELGKPIKIKRRR